MDKPEDGGGVVHVLRKPATVNEEDFEEETPPVKDGAGTIIVAATLVIVEGAVKIADLLLSTAVPILAAVGAIYLASLLSGHPLLTLTPLH